MKLRTAFVSNSSSSSYIITYNDSNVCEHCGRGDNTNFFKACEVATKADIIADREKDIARAKEDIARFSGLAAVDPDALCSRWPSDTTTVGQRLKWAQETVKEEEKYKAEAEAWPDDAIKIDISYHDEGLAMAFESAKENGSITVIESWD